MLENLTKTGLLAACINLAGAFTDPVEAREMRGAVFATHTVQKQLTLQACSDRHPEKSWSGY